MNDRPAIAWMQEQRNAAARAAALAIVLPPPADSLQTVTYTSAGATLVVGSADLALRCADQLCGVLPVTVLLTSPQGEGAQPARSYPVSHGADIQVSGWLGAFDVRWRDAGRGALRRESRFDLVLDLSSEALIQTHQKPHGYVAPGAGEADIAAAIGALAQMIGEFEKPKYFRYKERLCAHSRNGQTGCSACIDICSARAIASAGDLVRVNPYLCAGCGACTTVCPTGALAYAYPGAPYTGERLRSVLAHYAREGGLDPVILFHGAGQGSELVSMLHAHGEGQPGGLPSRVIPMELHHMAATGIDVWLSAVAYGASGIAVLVTDAEAPRYADALEDQMGIAQEILSGLGYAGVHFQLARAASPAQLGEALVNAPAGVAPPQAATFHVAQEKRNALDMALDHLFRHATLQPAHVPLPLRSPFGAIAVDKAACTLCMSCVGVCPSSALMDSDNAPQLRFVEKNCVQCGLCAHACPEDAVSLLPRMSFADTWNKAVLLNETEPFHCIRCSKPFGTVLMIQSMLGKLAQHSAFQGNLDRIRMCGDCRVIDIMHSQSAGETTRFR